MTLRIDHCSYGSLAVNFVGDCSEKFSAEFLEDLCFREISPFRGVSFEISRTLVIRQGIQNVLGAKFIRASDFTGHPDDGYRLESDKSAASPM